MGFQLGEGSMVGWNFLENGEVSEMMLAEDNWERKVDS